MLRQALLGAIDVIDRGCAAVSPGLIPESPALVSVLFHTLHRSRAEIETGTFYPQQGVTIDEFRLFVEMFLEAGYHAVGPNDVVAGLDPQRRHLMITFDDGYFNNSLALDAMNEYRVPATFFISSNHVVQAKSFWWDAFYRRARESAPAGRQVAAEIGKLKGWKTSRIEAHLRSLFGPSVLTPKSDLDRPFTTDELRDFSHRTGVHIGNHTADHAVLTNYSLSEAMNEIRDCQRVLADIAGYAPRIIAYPNGNYSPDLVEASRREGLSAGMTLRPRKNVPGSGGPDERMTLGRFILWGGRSIRAQCAVFRSEFVPTRYARRLYWGYGAR